MNTQSRIFADAALGALCGAAAAYLFFTERGQMLRDRFEPAVDELKREFGRFQKTIEKFGDLANDSMRVVQEFKSARGQYPSGGTTPH